MSLYANCPKCGAPSAGPDICAGEASPFRAAGGRAMAGLRACSAARGDRLLWRVACRDGHPGLGDELVADPLSDGADPRVRPHPVPAFRRVHDAAWRVAVPGRAAADLRRRVPAVMLWWSAVAVMDVAPYIYDAWKPQHVLLSGRTGDTGAHDFIDVLGDLGLLHRAQPIGYGVHAFGMLMLAMALAWGAY